jgi:chemotaxis family two-component system response regulator Rcp1
MALERTREPIGILLVEDDQAHVRLIREALKDGSFPHFINVASDGVEAMAYLSREGEYKEASQPDLVLLDLKLPRKDGREVLAEMKKDPELKHIPVIILTTSRSDEDILASYRNHANCYLVKPVDLDEFLGMVKGIEEFWMNLATLPP